MITDDNYRFITRQHTCESGGTALRDLSEGHVTEGCETEGHETEGHVIEGHVTDGHVTK